MSTQIRHGPTPQFTYTLDGRFSLMLVGYYTTQNGIAAGGVTDVEWHSTRPSKRLNECLAMRSIFRNWYERTLRELGYEPSGDYAL